VEVEAPKKKVVRKAKKKTDGEAVAADSAGEHEDSGKKKTTIIRRKVENEEVKDEMLDDAVELQEQIATDEDINVSSEEESFVANQADSETEEVEISESTSDAGIDKDKKDGSAGLRIVSVPVVKKQTVVTEAVVPSKTVEKKALYTEKVHKFTPVYIPPKVEKVDQDDETPVKKSATATGPAVTEVADEDGDSKRRIGGLASMMSAKSKSGLIGRSRDLSLERSEEELK
jgi:hypothetical protein